MAKSSDSERVAQGSHPSAAAGACARGARRRGEPARPNCDERGGLLGSLLGILVCGGVGGFVAWLAVNALELDGVTGAIFAAAIGMVVATALWIAGAWLLRATGIAR